jgi:hypothetical protein
MSAIQLARTRNLAQRWAGCITVTQDGRPKAMAATRRGVEGVEGAEAMRVTADQVAN